MRNLALACAALAFAGSIVSFTLWRELRAEQQGIAELRAQLQGLQQARPASAPVANAFAAAAVPPPPVSASAPESAPGSPAQRSAADTSADIGRMLSSRIEAEARLIEDPEYREARLAQARNSLAFMNVDLAEELGLTPEEADALFDLLARQQLEMSMLASPIATPRADGTVDVAAMTDAMNTRQQKQRDHEATLAAHLGQTRFEAYKKYQESSSARIQLRGFQQRLDAEGIGLTSAQRRALVPLYTEALNSQRDAITSMISGRVPGQAIDPAAMQQARTRAQEESNRRLVDEAAKLLDEGQLERFRESLEQQRQAGVAAQRAIEVQQRIRQATAAGASP